MRLRDRMALTAGLFVAATFLWSTPVVYPVKALVVLAHEASHGLAALLTGGSIDRIEVSSNLGGVCYTRGGWRVVILSAGYLGSMLFGGLLFWSAARTRLDREISGLLGLGLIALTLVYVRSWFGVLGGLAAGGAMIASAKHLDGEVNDVLLSFIGLTSMLYAVVDIKEDLISRTVPCSDAYQLSRILPLPSVVWGVLWAGTALVVLAVVLRASHVDRTPVR